ncbi:MAG: alpha/beta fold hydrolase [Gammaproteobacteria bacterium]|nr:alpha/beta fold hydrolase [Gammaproteobacteria bacterium]
MRLCTGESTVLVKFWQTLRKRLRDWRGAADGRVNSGRRASDRNPRGPRPSNALLVGCCVVLAAVAVFGYRTEAGSARESVVLMHGLGRTRASMALLAERLEWAGYDVANVDYDSRGGTLAEHAETLAAEVSACCAAAPRVHFVGHSLGGLVIRRYLADTPPESLGRVVLLAPPNQGSEVADWFREQELGHLLGPAGMGLGTGETGIPASLPPPEYEVGIIAGNRSFNPIGSALIPGPDDGMVGVDNTRIEDVPLIVVPRSHTFLMNDRFTTEAVIVFLRRGTFPPVPAPE